MVQLSNHTICQHGSVLIGTGGREDGCMDLLTDVLMSWREWMETVARCEALVTLQPTRRATEVSVAIGADGIGLLSAASDRDDGSMGIRCRGIM